MTPILIKTKLERSTCPSYVPSITGEFHFNSKVANIIACLNVDLIMKAIKEDLVSGNIVLVDAMLCYLHILHAGRHFACQDEFD